MNSDVGSTFQALRNHRYDDPLGAPGLADLTAHVDFEALGTAAASMGARVHGPVGLNIGAKSPAEIAISILGQIIEVRARRLEALSAPKVAAA